MKQEFPKDDFGVIIEKNNGKEIIDYLINKGFNNTECWTGNGALGMYSIPKESKTITYHDIVVSKTYTLEELKALDNMETKNIKVTELSKFSGKTTIVKINNKNEYDKLKKYYPNMFDYKEGYNYYLVDKTNSGLGNKPYDSNKYTTINFENIDFMEKKIIGYKAPYDLFGGKVKKEEIATPFFKPFSGEKAYHFKIKGLENTVSDTLPKEIVETWEPVYEPEKPKEIEINMGSFSLKLTKEGIFHKTENITDYVEKLNIWWKNVLNEGNLKFGNKNYDCLIPSSNITIEKSGCEKVQTKLSDWLKVWNKYQEFQK